MEENRFNLQKSAIQRRNGFTLIELLVVIAIVVLLAEILVSMFLQAQENAHRSSCANNLKQIGLAFMQYTHDYDETYPMRANGASTVSWRTYIFPYVKSVQLYSCPSNKNNAVPASDDIASPIAGINCSYATNYNLIGTRPPLSLADLQVPSRLIMVAESFEGKFELVLSRTTFGIPASNRGLFAGHLGTSNYVFADGHVKALKPLQTVIPSGPYTGTTSNFWVNTEFDAWFGSTPTTINDCYRQKLGQAETNQP